MHEMQSEIKYVSKKYILTWKANRMMKACLYILQSLNLEALRERTQNSLENNRLCVCLANPVSGSKLFFPFWSRNKHMICSKQSQKIGLLVPRTVFLLSLSFIVKWGKKSHRNFQGNHSFKARTKNSKKIVLSTILKYFAKGILKWRKSIYLKKILCYLEDTSSFFQKFVHDER